MNRRHNQADVEDFLEDFGGGIAVAAVVCIVAGLIGGFIFSLYTDDKNNTADDNIAFLKLMHSYGTDAADTSEPAAESRKNIAQAFVDLDKQTDELAGKSHTYLSFSGDQWKQVKAVAKTGKPAKLDTGKLHFTTVFHWPVLRWELLGIMTILGIGALWQFGDEYHLYRLADLPWKRRPWPWIFTILLGPLFWVAMAVSLVGLARDVRAARLHREEQARRAALREAARAQATEAGDGDGRQPERVYVVEDDDDDWYDEPERPAPKPRKVRKTYASSPIVAKAAYVTLRTTSSVKRQRQRLQEVEGQIAYENDDARELAAELRRTQTRLGQLRAEKTKLEAGVEDIAVSAEVAGDEFERIAKLPGVLATNVVNDNLRVIIRATHEYKGLAYDLGDWRIDLVPGMYKLVAYELRSGVRDGWGDYPIYRIGDGFCFGDRQEIINQHLVKGQYLEALALAAECLNGINEEDKHNIPHAFHVLKIEEES